MKPPPAPLRAATVANARPWFSRLLAAAAFFLLPATLFPALAATRVLYLGDSFSKGPFGTTLDAAMRAGGLEVYTSVTGGASLYDWLPDFGGTSSDIGYWEKTPKSERRVGYIGRVPKIDELVARWKPNVVVIQGGTNMYSVLTSKRRSAEQNEAELRRLYRRVGDICRSGGAKVYWITPATAHPQRFAPDLQMQMRRVLTDIFSDYGRVFDSYAVTRFTEPYPGSDGIHYGPTEASAWARLAGRDVVAWAKGAAPRSAPKPRRSFFDLFRRKSKDNAAATPEPERKTAAPARAERTERTEPAVTVRRAAPVEATPVMAAPPDEIEVDVQLLAKSQLTNLSDIAYKHCMGVFEYKVLAVKRGKVPEDHIFVSHLIVMNKQYTSASALEVGSRLALTLVPIERYPNILKMESVDDVTQDSGAVLWVPKL